MEQKIDWQAALDGSRPVTTRDGRKVTLYCVDAPGDWPVHGRINDQQTAASWRKNGGYYENTYGTALDLVHPPRRFKYERWVNVYEDGSTPISKTKIDADWASGAGRIACIRIVVEGEEGEGLE